MTRLFRGPLPTLGRVTSSPLGRFLRAKRDQLSPAQAGIVPFPGPRRVPGLRKEELAMVAGVSPDYLSRLEQGHQARVSTEVLEALARALRLDEVERAHLLDLARPARHRRRAARRPGQRPDPGLLRLMASLSHLPVLLLGHRSEVLATNALLETVLFPFRPGDSFVRFLFFDPAARERIVNWDHFAASTIGALRRESGRHGEDPWLTQLVDELRAADPDAARWWDDHTVRDYASVSKLIRHPVGGDLSFDIEIVAPPLEPDQRLVVYTVQPDSPTAKVLPILGSWQRQDRTQRDPRQAGELS